MGDDVGWFRLSFFVGLFGSMLASSNAILDGVSWWILRAVVVASMSKSMVSSTPWPLSLLASPFEFPFSKMLFVESSAYLFSIVLRRVLLRML